MSKIIPIPNKISDHPIIILKLKVSIKIKDTIRKNQHTRYRNNKQ